MFELLRCLAKEQKKFLLLCLGFSFLITLDYSCLRPASHALFITHFGAKFLPWVWLLSLPINFLIVSLFNKVQGRVGSKTLSRLFPWIVLGVNFALTQALSLSPIFSLVLFIWKDLYILLMFQQLWSQIHASMGSTVNKAFYGLMYTLGALGSLMGSFLPVMLKLQASQYLYSSLFVYPLIALVQQALSKHPLHAPFEKKQKASALEGLKAIFSSHELLTIGLLVAFMQMVSALAEFNFSYHLEVQFSDLGSRTKASASMMSLMHMLTLSFQLILSMVSIEKLGIKRGHRLLPLGISLSSIIYLIAPSFKTASMSYIGCKSLDFSFFSVLKESLYAPLDRAHMYQAKSFIDIFVYRGAKTLMSFGLILFSFWHSSLFFGMLILLMGLLWFFVAKSRLQNFQKGIE